MDKPKIMITIEALLKNGREVFINVELPRDEILEGTDMVTYRINAEPGITEDHVFHTSDVAYLRRREVIEARGQSEYRTLGREAVVPSR